MVKKLNCLLTTRESVMVSTQMMSRLFLCSSRSPSSQIMWMCGVFLHQIVKGWTDKEVVLTSHLVEGCESPVSAVMAPSYHLGTWPELEMHVRNVLSLVVFKEVAFEQERPLLETLFFQVCPMRDNSTLNRVLQLISSLAKEQDWQFGGHSH